MPFDAADLEVESGFAICEGGRSMLRWISSGQLHETKSPTWICPPRLCGYVCVACCAVIVGCGLLFFWSLKSFTIDLMQMQMRVQIWDWDFFFES